SEEMLDGSCCDVSQLVIRLGKGHRRNDECPLVLGSGGEIHENDRRPNVRLARHSFGGGGRLSKVFHPRLGKGLPLVLRHFLPSFVDHGASRSFKSCRKSCLGPPGSRRGSARSRRTR